MRIEAVLLTGGASRRMGTDKAALVKDGVTLAERVAAELASACDPVTVLGNEPIAGCRFLADASFHQGPLVALSAFVPSEDLVFVASCDLPWFDGRLVRVLSDRIQAADAALPVLDGRLQPLCALYRATTFVLLPELVVGGYRRMRDWTDRLRVATFEDAPDVWLARGVNTPAEWAQALSSGFSSSAFPSEDSGDSSS